LAPASPNPPTAAAKPPTQAAGRLVLVGDPDETRGKVSVEAIRGFGLEAQLVHDGVEAMLAIQRMLPSAVVLDVGLPRMYGFQICEIVKRNQSLKGTTVVLVGSVHDPSRDRREPSELYGADVFLEPADLPEGLRGIFRECGLLADGPAADRSPTRTAETALERTIATPSSPSAPSPNARPISAPVASQSPPPVVKPVASSPASSPASTPASAPASTAPADPAREEERERARRLARIAVSEMLLYQPDKFAQACREGTLERVLDGEIQEARALIRQRIGPEVRAEADFVLDELHRVARERGAKG
jgi:CheY-like chemotaxis protein